MNALRTASAALALLATTGIALAQGSVFSGETSTPGNSTHGALVAMGTAVDRAGLGSIQIQDGQTLTKSMLNVATGKTDIATLPNAAYHLLRIGKGPYEKLGAEQGSALADRIVALVGFQPGLFLPIVFDDSGITSFEDMRGKRIFVGPPSGVAAVNSMDILEAVAGLKAGEDYEEIRLDWAAAVDGMLDRKFDVMMFPTSDPSPAVQQFASSGNITIFGVPKEVQESEAWQSVVADVGSTAGTHRTTSYDSGVSYANTNENGEIDVLANTFFIGVSRDMDEEVAYRIVKSMFENMEAIEGTAAFMPALRMREGVVGLASTRGLKLHPGALRAMEEQGIDLPDALK